MLCEIHRNDNLKNLVVEKNVSSHLCKNLHQQGNYYNNYLGRFIGQYISMVLRPFSCSVVLCNIKVYIPNQRRPLTLDLTALFPSVKKQSPQEAVIP